VKKVSRKEREETVAALSKRFTDTKGVIAFDYKGLDVEKITGLRRQIKETGSELKVAKNTLLRISTQDTSYEPLQDSFVGQTAVAFIDGDPALAAKVLTKFVKANLKDNPEAPCQIKAGVLENKFLRVEEIDQLGNLPPREVLLGQFVSMLAAPVTGFVSVLADVPRKFLRVLAAVADQKKDDN
jgi:large subunit ribosomal protein L10